MARRTTGLQLLVLTGWVLAACSDHDVRCAVDDDGAARSSTVTKVKAPSGPRLIVAGTNGVRIWNDATAITSDVAPSAALAGIDGTAHGVALDGDTLLVTSSGTSAVYRFEGASTLENGAAPRSAVPASAFGRALSAPKLQVDRFGALWIQNSDGVRLLARGASAPSANFTHPWQGIQGFVYDEAGDTLYGGQIQGAGVLAWRNPAADTGDVASDYQLADSVAWHMKIADGRLYGSGYGRPVTIWNGISTTTAPKAPDITITGLCDEGGARGEIRYMTVTDDTLVVLHSRSDGRKLVEEVCLFKNAHAISGLRAPDAIARGALEPSSYDKVQLTRDGHLFVRDKTGIAIFKDAATVPIFVTRVTSELSGMRDFVVLE